MFTDLPRPVLEAVLTELGPRDCVNLQLAVGRQQCPSITDRLRARKYARRWRQRSRGLNRSLCGTMSKGALVNLVMRLCPTPGHLARLLVSDTQLGDDLTPAWGDGVAPHLIEFWYDTDDDQPDPGPGKRKLGVRIATDTELVGQSLDTDDWRRKRQFYQDRLDTMMALLSMAFYCPWPTWDWVLQHPHLTHAQRSALGALRKHAFSYHFPSSMFLHAHLRQFRADDVRDRLRRVLQRCRRADLAHMAQCLKFELDFRQPDVHHALVSHGLFEALLDQMQYPNGQWPWRFAHEKLTSAQVHDVEDGVRAIL